LSLDQSNKVAFAELFSLLFGASVLSKIPSYSTFIISSWYV